MYVLKTHELTKNYGNKAAVDSVSLEIAEGDIFGLIGQNGAGKSTFMRMVAGLTIPSSGSIELFGENNQHKLNKIRHKIGSIIEGPSLFGNLSAKQNLEYYRLQQNICDKARVTEVLKMVNLENTGNKKFKNFSMGMKQRLGLACAIISRPSFLILDEPINGLDPTGIINMRNLIKAISQDGITICISSHILTELAEVANKYVIIHHGKLIKSITQDKLMQECKQALSITVDSIEKASEELKSIGINNYKVASQNEIHIYDKIDDTAEINSRLVTKGIKVSSLKEIGDTLEEYYLKIIGSEAR